ncbi:hypothetical protein B0T40_18110 [Chromobacterium haemolyticum]|uniref:AMP-binding protein n=1 Tax=Chromobacterium haemolyticum TaxID=394935 RepID=UPI0009F0B897|nr:AMP-binding protein [Chromobacterium haemolyticum]OQS33161.1 hypothetical protein B0T40_18110 [Chromobacterium haemolyticum]
MSLLALEHLLSGERDPERVAALRDGRPLLWRDFTGAVTGAAATLEPGQRYALIAADAWLFAVGLFAVWRAGAEAMVPNNALPATLSALAPAFDEVLDDAALRARMSAPAASAATQALDGEGCRLTLFTSGSTGEPKSIVKCLRQLSAEVAVLERSFGAQAGDACVLATVPHHHIYGLLFRLLWPLSAGRVFEATPHFLPEDLLEAAAGVGRAVLIGSPAQLSRLPELIDLPALLSRTRLCVSSGGPLPADAAAAFAAAGGEPPLEIFGSTETGGVAWRRQLDGDRAWTPLPSVSCSVGEEGALRVASPFLPDDAPWLASDAVEFLPDGRFLLQGRRDRVVKLAEKRLSLGEQEQRLADHPWLAAAALLVLPGRRDTLCAVVALSAQGRGQLHSLGKLAVQQALRRYLAAWYEPVLLPRRWRFVDLLPQTERGKPDRTAMLELF